MPRVLFIDGFGASAKSQAAAKTSMQTLRTAIKSLTDRGVCPLDFEIKVAHPSKLDGYTLGHPAGHEQVLREIDKLDVIVLDGDSSTLPWSPILDPLATLVRMCVSARKCIFAAGRTANILAFVLANGTRGKPFTVVNGDGMGTPITMLDDFDAEAYQSSSAENFAFLDSDTGDLCVSRCVPVFFLRCSASGVRSSFVIFCTSLPPRKGGRSIPYCSSRHPAPSQCRRLD
jgi:hypothetical protein